MTMTTSMLWCGGAGWNPSHQRKLSANNLQALCHCGHPGVSKAWANPNVKNTGVFAESTIHEYQTEEQSINNSRSVEDNSTFFQTCGSSAFLSREDCCCPASGPNQIPGCCDWVRNDATYIGTLRKRIIASHMMFVSCSPEELVLLDAHICAAFSLYLKPGRVYIDWDLYEYVDTKSIPPAVTYGSRKRERDEFDDYLDELMPCLYTTSSGYDHVVSSALNGCNGEATNADDLAARTHTGIDAGLAQLTNALQVDDRQSQHSDYSDRKRNRKAAANRRYQKHTRQRYGTTDSDESTPRSEPRVEHVPPTQPVAVKEPVPVPAYSPVDDLVRRKIFLVVPQWKLPASGKWNLFCSLMIIIFLLGIMGPAVFCFGWYGLGFVIPIIYVMTRMRIPRRQVDTSEWRTGGETTIYAIGALEHSEDTNIAEINAMAHAKYNAFRLSSISLEAYAWLSKNKMGKPSDFSQQQYADYVLRQFSGRASDTVLIDTATFHHQNLVTRHFMFKLQCGTVENLMERL